MAPRGRTLTRLGAEPADARTLRTRVCVSPPVRPRGRVVRRRSGGPVGRPWLVRRNAWRALRRLLLPRPRLQANVPRDGECAVPHRRCEDEPPSRRVPGLLCGRLRLAAFQVDLRAPRAATRTPRDVRAAPVAG